MVTRRPDLAGRVLYAALWCVVIPLLLVVWARATTDVVPLPTLRSQPAGAAVLAAGLLLAGAGMVALIVSGGGLPMNAYPPPRLVKDGVYGWVAHPIYVGSILCVAGLSIATGSASGLWLVTPAAALALAALVLGYERHDMRQRFGALPRPRLALPRAAAGEPGGWERASVYVLVLLPWLIAYEAVHALGVPRDAIDSHLPFERHWPVLQWTELVYASAYVMILATPLLVRTRTTLRRFAVHGLLATASVTFIYLMIPFVAPPRPFEPTTALGRLLALERAMSNTVAAFPAFHVLWPLIATAAWTERGRAWGIAAAAWTAAIAASCITTGMHSLVDVVAAFVVFPVITRSAAAWAWLRSAAERVANSWREWRVGPVRIINHGFYTAGGGALGLWIAATVAGPELMPAVVFAAVFSLLVSAIWAQVIEGSPALLRPLGFYGGIAGGLAAFGILALLGLDVVRVVLGFGLAMPWVQAAGRLRCLVQGCCHGGPTHRSVGIRYVHSRSRVTRIAGLAGVPLHPTPLYSLLANIVTGLLLLRLQLLGAGAGIIIGAYFMLNGIARFVEESYRAEPQTPIVARLRIYQWFAVVSFLVGMAATTVAAAPLPAAGHPLDPALLPGVLAVGLLALFITGIDFPASNRRFSRLADAEGTPRLLAAFAGLPPELRPHLPPHHAGGTAASAGRDDSVATGAPPEPGAGST